ncbi:MAG: FRG domain-containing protein [Flavobacteriales bacterium]|jgi:hypothetical protein|nr:FRG domain-containing protein [Flavobacteriales bacterium]
MVKAPNYITKEEKNAVFKEIGYIHYQQEVDQLFDLLASDRQQGFFYRGNKRAGYKLFTSGQRYWIESEKAGGRFRDHHHMYINRLYDLRTRDDLPFKELFKRWGIDSNDDMAMLSLLQHYGGVTPFLDLSEDPYVALYFAVEERDREPEHPTELDAYCAFYTFPRDLVHVLNRAFQQTVERQRNRGDIDTGRIYSEYRFFHRGYFLIMHHEWVEKHLGPKHGKLHNNLNIIRQRGLFAYNSTADLPVPEALQEFEKQFRKSGVKGQWVSEQLKCVNIHIGLVPYIRERLAALSPSYDKDYVMPNMKAIFERVWEEGPNY